MGFRFRKSVGNGIFRVNFSKSGVGCSAGVKGARITKKSNGGTRTTVGIPGTGLSYVKDSSGKKAYQSSGSRTHTPYFAFAILIKIVGFLTIVFSALLALVFPAVGLIGIALGISELFWGKSLKKKGIQQAAEEAALQEEEEAAAAQN